MIDNKTYWNLKSRLTRAKNRAKKYNNPQLVIDEVTHARKIFEKNGYPDLWPMWRNELWNYGINSPWYRDIDPIEARVLIMNARNEEEQWTA